MSSLSSLLEVIVGRDWARDAGLLSPIDSGAGSTSPLPHGIDRTERVIQPMSTWRNPATGQYHLIKIETSNPLLPRSEADFLLLNLCRARADFILTSGQNLRAESELQHCVMGPYAPELNQWRASALGRTHEPVAAVLTRGQIDVRHDAFVHGTASIIATTCEGAEVLGAQQEQLIILATDDMNCRSAVTHLMAHGRQQGINCAPVVSVEVGSTSCELHVDPCMVDELFFAVFTGDLDIALRGKQTINPFESSDFKLAHQSDWQEASGLWQFYHFLCKSTCTRE